ncbi:MAG: type II toxin-antitoxin system VapC family toxin [Anaerolineae bacterium]|nr:type II toxin-antitoxin system VapC family toxin [Anaerolineae bacterium]
MSVVDASVWVSRYVMPDINHQSSQRWLTQQATQGKPLFAPILVLAEVGSAVARQTGRQRLGQMALSGLLNFPNLRLVPIDTLLGHTAAQIAISLGVKGSDAVYVALAQQLGVPIITWDNQQRVRAAQLVTALTP